MGFSASSFFFKQLKLTRHNFSPRYEDDVVDRIWSPYTYVGGEAIVAPSSNTGFVENVYELPVKVMETAVKPGSGNTLDFYLDGIDSSQKFYLCMHFAELETLGQNQTREFSFSVNKEILGVIRPRYMAADTYYTPSTVSGSRLNFSFTQTTNSTMPPIINAMEIYMIKQFLQLPTEQSNGM